MKSFLYICTMEKIWKDIRDLPIDKPMHEKVLLVSDETISGNTVTVVSTDFWNVHIEKRDVDMSHAFDKKAKLKDGTFGYGRLDIRKIPLKRVKKWADAKELI